MGPEWLEVYQFFTFLIAGSEQIHARRRGQPAHTPGQRRSSPVGAEAGPDGGEDADSGIIEGAEGGGLEEGVSLGPGAAPDTDTLSLLSLRTVAGERPPQLKKAWVGQPRPGAAKNK